MKMAMATTIATIVIIIMIIIFDISGDDSSEWLYIGTLLVDGFCSNHLSGPAADDGELINSRAVFMSALIMSNLKAFFFLLL